MELNCVLLTDGLPQTGARLELETPDPLNALTPLAGKPMGQWVLDALTEASQVGSIVVVGADTSQSLTSPKIVARVTEQGRFLANLVAGLDRMIEIQPQSRYVLFCTADIPLITGDIVNQVVARWEALQRETEADMYYHVIPRALMEQQFAAANRKCIRLLEGDFAGANMHVLATHLARRQQDLWGSLLDSSENILQQVIRLGGDFFFKLMTRRLSMEELEGYAPKRLGIRLKVVASDFAEIGMEANKPFRLDICRDALEEKRHGGTGSTEKP
ncbi:MAG: NTP transferase domain-containing protein [Anaerolineae bacterium]|nr:NTP transferase domain-containing protein [Anaerolineae bacterium]